MDPQVTQLQKEAAERQEVIGLAGVTASRDDALSFSNTPLDRIAEATRRLARALDRWR